MPDKEKPDFLKVVASNEKPKKAGLPPLGDYDDGIPTKTEEDWIREGYEKKSSRRAFLLAMGCWGLSFTTAVASTKVFPENSRGSDMMIGTALGLSIGGSLIAVHEIFRKK